MHFVELCDVLGQPHPSDEAYTFEKGATKTEGGHGFADVWKRGHFAWEYKGKHKNLDVAYQQLLKYREDLDNPPLLVVCDLVWFEVHTNFTGTAKRVYRFSLDDLLKNVATAACVLPPLDVLRALFTDPNRLRPDRTTEEVTEMAAAEFATLADSLRKTGNDPQRAAHFLMRLLFCLFGEDIGLLPPKLFSRLLERTRTRPTEFRARLGELFKVMATGGAFGADDIAHFNGDLFTDAAVLDLSVTGLETLLRVSELDWSSIEPAIFGTLFERSLDPGKRSQLGAHYTSRDDILLIVEPVLIAPLRRRWAEVRVKAEKLLEKPKSGKAEGKKLQTALRKLLLGFVDDLSHVRVLDPACGSGNFLYVSLKLLLDLWKEISVYAGTHGLPHLLPYQVNPAQLYGIEANIYAHELASVVVWIGYIQWLHDNGFGVPPSPILQRLHNIRHMDAVLAHDKDGKPVEPEWPEVDVITGNPPFLGGKKMRSDLGDKYVDELFGLYDGRVPREADFVTYWFEKARVYIEQKKVARAGLLATQGIRGGANRKVLERIKETGDIFWAQSDRDWILDGANVHVSMVAFDNGSEACRELDGVPVPSINPNLTATADFTAAHHLIENENLGFMGVTRIGPFDISPELAKQMLDTPLNPNGRPNSDVVRPWINGRDITSRSRGMCIIDFGVDATEEAAALYEMPFEYVKTHVKPLREPNNRASYAEKWWLFGEPRPAMRRALSNLSRFAATSMVSKHRLFVWVPASVVAENLVTVIAREDDYFLGVLQSSVHTLWAHSMGTALEDRPRYTATTTFETFPFPWPPGKESENDPRVIAIASAARTLVESRDNWLNPPGASPAELKKRTLTNLYNQSPQWLDDAHRALDKAVLVAYGWPEDISDTEILERLLILNRERAAISDAMDEKAKDGETS
jgi:MmeI, DNA-methyltransferase domain/MmeI, helicase spacer domain/MmeI, target recognition domain/MmeI, N-terminal domain